MTVEDWLRIVTTDAETRGLPQLKPLLESLGLSTGRLREADFRLRGPSAVEGKAEAARDVVDAGTDAPERER